MKLGFMIQSIYENKARYKIEAHENNKRIKLDYGRLEYDEFTLTKEQECSFVKLLVKIDIGYKGNLKFTKDWCYINTVGCTEKFDYSFMISENGSIFEFRSISSRSI
ncbi:unnamed protein product [Cunninghamella echinulata]